MLPFGVQRPLKSANSIGVSLRSTKKTAVAAQGLVTRVLSHAMELWYSLSSGYATMERSDWKVGGCICGRAPPYLLMQRQADYLVLTGLRL